MRKPLEMNPVEFEIWVKNYIEGLGCELSEFRVDHLETLPGVDGDYTIDITARFEALNISFLVVIECKRYARQPVKREQLQSLYQKMLSVAAQKAIAFSTSGFQRGAVEFASTHGIALVHVEPDDVRIVRKSWMPSFKLTLITAEETIAHYISNGIELASQPRTYPSEQASCQAFTLGVLRQQYDYARVLESRGMADSSFDQEKLRAEIAAAEEHLRRLIEQAARDHPVSPRRRHSP